MFFVILSPSLPVILSPSLPVILTPSLPVILSVAKNLMFLLRIDSAKNLKRDSFRLGVFYEENGTCLKMIPVEKPARYDVFLLSKKFQSAP